MLENSIESVEGVLEQESEFDSRRVEEVESHLAEPLLLWVRSLRRGDDVQLGWTSAAGEGGSAGLS